MKWSCPVLWSSVVKQRGERTPSESGHLNTYVSRADPIVIWCYLRQIRPNETLKTQNSPRGSRPLWVNNSALTGTLLESRLSTHNALRTTRYTTANEVTLKIVRLQISAPFTSTQTLHWRKASASELANANRLHDEDSTRWFSTSDEHTVLITWRGHSEHCCETEIVWEIVPPDQPITRWSIRFIVDSYVQKKRSSIINVCVWRLTNMKMIFGRREDRSHCTISVTANLQ